MKPLPEKALQVLFKRQPILFAYLFGSRAQGRTGPLSDTDIAFYPQKSLSRSQRFEFRLRLLGQIIDVLRDDKVDLVDLTEAPLPLRFQAIQPARLLFSRDERKRIRFELRTMSEYFDRQYYIRRGTDQTLARVAQKGLL